MPSGVSFVPSPQEKFVMFPSPSPMDCLSAFVVVFALGTLTALAAQRMTTSSRPGCPHAN